jgi:cell division protein FtsL
MSPLYEGLRHPVFYTQHTQEVQLPTKWTALSELMEFSKSFTKVEKAMRVHIPTIFATVAVYRFKMIAVKCLAFLLSEMWE